MDGDPNAVFDRLMGIGLTLEQTHGIKLRKIQLLKTFGHDTGHMYIPTISEADVKRLEEAVSGPNRAIPGMALTALRKLLIRDWERENRNVSIDIGRLNQGGPRILFASNPSAFSGSEQALICTVRALAGRKWNLDCLIAHEGLFSDRLKEEDVAVHCPRRDFARASVPNFLWAGALLDAVAPGILHCNAYVGTPLLAQARQRGITILQWARTARFDGMLDHLITADLITAVSEFVRRRLEMELVDPSKVRVVYDGIDTETFRPPGRGERDMARHAFGFLPSDYVLLCASRLVPYKRHDVLLKGLARACEFTADVQLRLVLAGESESGYTNTMNSMCTLASALGI
jgi:glycosyltransferase involved in cell wall biosynthesis